MFGCESNEQINTTNRIHLQPLLFNNTLNFILNNFEESTNINKYTFLKSYINFAT